MSKLLTKKNFTRIFQIFLVVFVISRLAPQVYSNWQKQGMELESFDTLNVATNEIEPLFLYEKNFIIFWASWCAPCKLEMMRIKRLVDSQDVRADQVIALNPFESLSEVQKFVATTDYPFRFLSDEGLLAQRLEVKGTPTFLWVKDETIVKMSTGIHLTGLFRLESFLAN